jgi:hypothetical protein
MFGNFLDINHLDEKSGLMKMKFSDLKIEL